MNVFYELLCSSQCEAFTKIYGSRLQKVLGQRMEGTHACEVKTCYSKEPPLGEIHALHDGDREAGKSLRVGGAERQADDILNAAKQQDKQFSIHYFAIVCLNYSAFISQRDVIMAY